MSFSSESPAITQVLRPLHGRSANTVDSVVDDYLRFFDQPPKTKSATDDLTKADADAVETRRKNALALVNAYFDVTTDFFELSFGEAIHFAVLRPEESREHSVAKHEYYLAMKLGLKPGESVLVSEQTVGMCTFKRLNDNESFKRLRN